VSAHFQFEGFEELKAALRQLPAELTGEASHIIEGAANAAIVDMRAEYPPGELRDKLAQTTLGAGQYGVGIQIKNSSGWSWHWDHGTKLRHTTDKKRKAHPTGAEWGGTTPPHTFGRTMAQTRRWMWAQLKTMLERHGLQVSGDA
jgi:hypothetical protein